MKLCINGACITARLCIKTKGTIAHEPLLRGSCLKGLWLHLHGKLALSSTGILKHAELLYVGSVHTQKQWHHSCMVLSSLN